MRSLGFISSARGLPTRDQFRPYLGLLPGTVVQTIEIHNNDYVNRLSLFQFVSAETAAFARKILFGRLYMCLPALSKKRIFRDYILVNAKTQFPVALLFRVIIAFIRRPSTRCRLQRPGFFYILLPKDNVSVQTVNRV